MIVVGALLAVVVDQASSASWQISKGLGFFALILASVNIFGGFLVTQRMLAMYARRKSEAVRAMNANIAALLYLAAGVLFILALRGLSSPETSRAGNRRAWSGWRLRLARRWPGKACRWHKLGADHRRLRHWRWNGAVHGAPYCHDRDAQLVAAFHSLVGLAAVLVAAAALYSPDAYGICVYSGNMCTGIIRTQSLIEMSIGVAIGAITFAGFDHCLRQIERQYVRRPDPFAGASLSSIC